MGRRDSSGNLSQFHYARPDRPYLVTQVFYPRESSLTNLVYDHQDKLVLVKINQVLTLPLSSMYYSITSPSHTTLGSVFFRPLALHFLIY